MKTKRETTAKRFGISTKNAARVLLWRIHEKEATSKSPPLGQLLEAALDLYFDVYPVQNLQKKKEED